MSVTQRATPRAAMGTMDQRLREGELIPESPSAVRGTRVMVTGAAAALRHGRRRMVRPGVRTTTVQGPNGPFSSSRGTCAFLGSAAHRM
eukprot:12618953-Alexandrium_andersonii.AAC.1